MGDDINVQFTPEQLNFFAWWEYRDIKMHRVERPKMSSIECKAALEHELDKDVEKGIRNSTDEETVEKESVTVKSRRIRNATDEKAVRKESVESKG